MLAKAQMSERTSTKSVYCHGKNGSTVDFRKRLNYSTMVYPTTVPIRMPREQLVKTRMRAS